MYIEEEDEDKKTGVKPESTSIGAGAADATPDGSSPSGGSGTSNAPSQPEGNQSFATVQDYLKSNTTQGNELGDKFAGKLDTTLSGEKSSVLNGINAFGDEVNAGTVNSDSGLVNDAANNPTSVANDPNRLSDWMKQYNAAYAGPSSFENSDVYSQASSAANEAKQKGELVKDTGGREQLLQDEFNDYGQGNRGLDQALLQNSGRSADIQAFAPKFAGVGDYLKQASGNAANQVAGGVSTSQATKDAAHAALDPRITGFQSDLAKRVSDAQTQAGAAGDTATKIKSDLASGNPDTVAQDLRTAGVGDPETASISNYLKNLNSEYGVSNPDLSKFYSFNPATDVNAANVATPEDYQKAAAYQKLSGINLGGVLNPADAAKAGTYGAEKTNIDTQGLTKYLQNQLGTQDTQFLNDLATKPVGAFVGNTTPEELSNPAPWTDFANKVVSALTRTGVKPSYETLPAAIKKGYEAYKNSGGNVQPGPLAFYKALEASFQG